MTVDEKIDSYHSLKPSQFCELESCTLRQQVEASGIMEQSLSLVFSRRTDDNRLYLDFWGVRGLVLKQPEFSQITCWLEVLSGDTYETVSNRFIVRDPEQTEVFRFECRDFQAAIGGNGATHSLRSDDR